MKKFLIITSVIIVVLVSVFFVFGEYIPEIPSRLAKYHNIINITVIKDGKPIDVDSIEVSFKHESGRLIDKQAISSGKVCFEKGVYGTNLFSLKIPNENIGKIQAEFANFNTNWWHICKYDVSLDIITAGKTEIKATLKCDIDIHGKKDTYTSTKILTKEDNSISSNK